MCALIPGRHFHFLRNGMFPTPWHNLTKEISWKNTGGLLFSCELSALLHVSACWWKLPIPDHPSDSGVFTLLELAVIGSCLWPFPLWHRDKWACTFMCVHAYAHSQPPASVPYRFSHSRPAEKTGKSPHLCLHSHTAQKQTIFLGQDRVKVRSVLLAPLPGKCPLSWMRTLRKLCLSFLNNKRFHGLPQVGYVFHLMLMMLSQYCAGTSTALLRAIFPLCHYCTIQAEVGLFQK